MSSSGQVLPAPHHDYGGKGGKRKDGEELDSQQHHASLQSRHHHEHSSSCDLGFPFTAAAESSSQRHQLKGLSPSSSPSSSSFSSPFCSFSSSSFFTTRPPMSSTATPSPSSLSSLTSHSTPSSSLSSSPAALSSMSVVVTPLATVTSSSSSSSSSSLSSLSSLSSSSSSSSGSSSSALTTSSATTATTTTTFTTSSPSQTATATTTLTVKRSLPSWTSLAVALSSVFLMYYLHIQARLLSHALRLAVVSLGWAGTLTSTSMWWAKLALEFAWSDFGEGVHVLLVTGLVKYVYDRWPAANSASFLNPSHILSCGRLHRCVPYLVPLFWIKVDTVWAMVLSPRNILLVVAVARDAIPCAGIIISVVSNLIKEAQRRNYSTSQLNSFLQVNLGNILWKDIVLQGGCLLLTSLLYLLTCWTASTLMHTASSVSLPGDILGSKLAVVGSAAPPFEDNGNLFVHD